MYNRYKNIQHKNRTFSQLYCKTDKKCMPIYCEDKIVSCKVNMSAILLFLCRHWWEKKEHSQKVAPGNFILLMQGRRTVRHNSGLSNCQIHFTKVNVLRLSYSIFWLFESETADWMKATQRSNPVWLYAMWLLPVLPFLQEHREEVGQEENYDIDVTPKVSGDNWRGTECWREASWDLWIKEVSCYVETHKGNSDRFNM